MYHCPFLTRISVTRSLYCSEYMDEPVSCGQSQCSGRFCLACLLRVARAPIASTERRGMTPHPSLRQAKCPCCRSDFTTCCITHDMELKAKMQSWNNDQMICCSHPHCDRLFKLHELKQHEAACDRIVLQCRYMPLGCKWNGPKHALEHHDKIECPYNKVQGLVDQFRLMKVVYDQQLNQLSSQVVALNHMMQVQNDTLVMVQSNRNVYDAVDVLSLVYMCLCYPIRFLINKDLWRQMFKSVQARVAVYNALCCLPMALIVVKVCSTVR